MGRISGHGEATRRRFRARQKAVRGVDALLAPLQGLLRLVAVVALVAAGASLVLRLVSGPGERLQDRIDRGTILRAGVVAAAILVLVLSAHPSAAMVVVTVTVAVVAFVALGLADRSGSKPEQLTPA